VLGDRPGVTVDFVGLVSAQPTPADHLSRTTGCCGVSMSIDYLDAAAVAGSAYKSRLAAAMDIRPGHTVLDLGCGPGIDLRDMAGRAGAAGRVANCTIGRQPVRLAPQAGLRIRSVEAIPVLFRDFDTADRILGLRRNTARAVRTRAIRERDAAPWLARLETGPLLATTIVYLVTASRQVSS
jgi:hypothetical protein